MRLGILALGGCWTASQPAPESTVVLRRHQAVGDHLRACERGDAVFTADGIDPTAITIRKIWNENVIARPSPDHLQIRIDILGGSTWQAEGRHEPSISTAQDPTTGEPFMIDDRNRQLVTPVSLPAEAEPAPPTPDFAIGAYPNLPDLLDMTYPAGILHAGDSFPLHYRRTVREAGSVPTKVVVDLRFVVKTIDATQIELACSGTHEERAQRREKRAFVKLGLTCRAVIDRRDGRTGRWWIDAHGSSDIPAPDGPEVMNLRSHFDVVFGRVPGDTTCARAAAPDAPDPP